MERVIEQARALGIMAKAPVAGNVKTRLCPPLNPDHAAMLYSAFVRDAILTGLAVKDCAVSLILPEGTEQTGLREIAPDCVSFVYQPGNGLGEGLRGAVQLFLNAGKRSVALIASDSPTLPPEQIERGFACLEANEADVVLGPASDGGYYLIAVQSDHPELFREIDWSTEHVLRQTLERAEQAGLRVSLLPEWDDIDDGESLARLVRALGVDGHLAAPATRAALQTLRRLGAPIPEAEIPWTVVSQTWPYRSKWRSLVDEVILTHEGSESDYSYLDAPDAVWIVPVTRQGDIVLVRQYRHPVRDWMLEVPAGGLDGLEMRDAAIKELEEEVGGHGGEVSYAGAFYSSSGQTTLRAHVFVAFGVEVGTSNLEPTELMETVVIPAELAFDMARRGEISDGQSALALLFCELPIRRWLSA